MTTLATPKHRWYESLMSSHQALVRKHDLPQDIADEFLGFVIDVAKSQYRAGNSSGISWARKNPVREAPAMG